MMKTNVPCGGYARELTRELYENLTTNLFPYIHDYHFRRETLPLGVTIRPVQTLVHQQLEELEDLHE